MLVLLTVIIGFILWILRKYKETRYAVLLLGSLLPIVMVNIQTKWECLIGRLSWRTTRYESTILNRIRT